MRNGIEIIIRKVKHEREQKKKYLPPDPVQLRWIAAFMDEDACGGVLLLLWC